MFKDIRALSVANAGEWASTCYGLSDRSFYSYT